MLVEEHITFDDFSRRGDKLDDFQDTNSWSAIFLKVLNMKRKQSS